jgi:hypothetical protein
LQYSKMQFFIEVPAARRTVIKMHFNSCEII